MGNRIATTYNLLPLKYQPRCQREGFQSELICEYMAWQWTHVPSVRPTVALKILKKKV